MGEWIDVNIEKPPKSKKVWVHDSNEGVIIGLYAYYGWYRACGDYSNGEDALDQVTHWMLIDKPSPPGPSETK